MNLSQLKANGYKVFNRQRNDNKEANILSLQYIEGLAARTGVDISAWDLLEIFGGEGRREYDLLKDKNAINKIFFEREAQFRESGDANIQHIKSMVGVRAREISQALRARRATQLERDYAGQMQQVMGYAANMEDYLRRANVTWKQIQDVKGQTSNLEDEVVAVLRENFWKYRDFNGANILYETASDIILTEVNPSAGLDIRVNLGKFVAEITLENCNLRMYPMCTIVRGSPNVDVDGFFHPHISGDGTVCWGDVKTKALGFQSRGELAKLMSTLGALLSSFSPTAPYRALASFARKQKEKEKLDNGKATQIEETQAQGQTQGIGTITGTGTTAANNIFFGTIASGGAAPGPNFRSGFEQLRPFGAESNSAIHAALRQQLADQQIVARRVDGNWQLDTETAGRAAFGGHAGGPAVIDDFVNELAERSEDDDHRWDDGDFDDSGDSEETTDEETEEGSETSEASGPNQG